MTQVMLNSWHEKKSIHTNYDVGNEIIYNNKVLKSNLWDYNDPYI